MKPAVKLAAVFCAMCIVDLLPAATAADTLPYDIKPKQKVAYRVKIVVSTPSATETMQGVIVYTGTTANEQVLTVEYNGGLKKSTKSKTTSRGPGGGRFGRRPGGPPIPRSPWDQPDFRGLVTSTNTLVITRDGTVESMRGDSQLPFLLGNLSLMMCRFVSAVSGVRFSIELIRFPLSFSFPHEAGTMWWSSSSAW